MDTNPLQRLHALGQSVWLDLIRRTMLEAEGVRKFVEPFDELLAALAAKRQTAGGPA